MKKPMGVIWKMFVVLAAVSLFACFNITVNVYFPAKDVKSAFKSLEQDLMKGAPEGTEPGQGEPGTAPEEGTGTGPQSRLIDLLGPDSAYAQGSGELSSELAEKLRDDPDVVKAYAEMGSRLGYINRLRDSGMVGEANNGMLSARQTLGKKESLAVDKENDNRNSIIWAMAKAIVEINGQPVNNDTIRQVLDKAASEFAAVRRDSAKPGWWIQKPDGSWVQK
jgi:Protein of unknown function (DUF1318)